MTLKYNPVPYHTFA